MQVYGAPHIYAGDEMGMWGADDPSCRKPLIWTDYDFEDESAHPLDMERPVDKVRFNDDLFAYYQKVIKIRRQNPVLFLGKISFINSTDKKLLAYSRYDNENEIITIINSGEETIEFKSSTRFSTKYSDILNNTNITQEGKNIRINIEPKTAVLLKSN